MTAPSAVAAATGLRGVRDGARVLRRRFAGEARLGWLIASPAFAGLLIFSLAPCLVVFAMALSDWQLGAASARFVGAANFRALADDDAFWISARNTLVYGVAVSSGSLLLGLALALLVEASPLGRLFFRTAFFLPVVSTTVAMAVVWEFLLHPTLGPVNVALKGLGLGQVPFLADADLVLPTLCAIGIWENAGFNMVLFLAGLRTIPRDLYEAAALDGAQPAWERFWTVTFPMLGPALLFVAVISLVRSFKVFDTIVAITQGGPHRASEVMLFTIYQEGFGFFRIGYASALTIVFLAALVGITALQMRLLDRRVHYR
jgi:multiple sugar transport system permease protein